MSGRPGSSFPVDPAECWRSSKSALELFTGLGDRAAEAIVQTGLAQLRAQQSQYTQALEHAKESPRLRHALGADTAIAHSEQTVGEIYVQLGQHDMALRHCRRALDLSRETGDRVRRLTPSTSSAISTSASATTTRPSPATCRRRLSGGRLAT